jgi:hypothetical protein
LEAKVERLVREHLAELRKAVKAALDRAFAVSPIFGSSLFSEFYENCRIPKLTNARA